MSEMKHDWPPSLPGAHGRISAYRSALVVARDALLTAHPYVANSIAAKIDRAEVEAALTRIELELGVTNP